jgi:mono/diheme cytochrome c family protein
MPFCVNVVLSILKLLPRENVMKKICFVLFSILLITGCGQSQEEKQRIAEVACAIMFETRNMDAAIRVEKLNEAREQIDGKPFLDGDAKIKEAVGMELCTELILDDGTYERRTAEIERRAAEIESKIAQRKALEAEKERKASGLRAIALNKRDLGEKVYVRNCAACHQSNGKGIPSAFPALTTREFLDRDKSNHISLIANGKAGTAMQAFGDILSPEEIAAVITFTLNSWGNSSKSPKTILVTKQDVLSYLK